MEKICFFSLLLIFISGCTGNEVEDNLQTQVADTATVCSPDSAEISVLEKLIKTDTGIFRGVTFGMSAEHVKVLEKNLELEEESPQFIDYIINYNFPESAEVIYYFDDKGNVTRIEAVVYPENKESQKALFDTLVKYYSDRYGSYDHLEGDTLQWSSDLDSVTVQLTKKDAQKVHDINLIFSPGSRQGASTAL